jgi:hypothetical protein
MTNRNCLFAAGRRQHRLRLFPLFCSAIFPVILFFGATSLAQPQSSPSTTWAVTIVLPPKLVADRPATLAVLGVDGRLAEGVIVDLGSHSGIDVRVKTDKTGRAVFLAPSDTNVLIAKASGASAAALLDPPPALNSAQTTISLPPVVSLQDAFPICGGAFHGEVEADHVTLDGDPALVLAASPECVVILPGPRALPGPAKISIQMTRAPDWTGETTLVALHFDPPTPPLVTDKKSNLVLHVQASDQPLNILVENKTPGILRFIRGDSQKLVTSGGAQNVATIEIQAISTGDFSFRARLLASPEPEIARRYLEAAAKIAPKDLQHQVQNLAKRLEHSPRDAQKVAVEIQKMALYTMDGDFRTLLNSAHSALE